MINDFNNSINKSYWENMNDEQLNQFVHEIFNHYRSKGFPYYEYSHDEKMREFEKLKSFDRTNLIDNDVVKQTMHGLGLAWSYFPHSFSVKCNKKLSPFEAFYNDEIFLNVIKKRLKMGTYISDSGIRKMLKIYSGVQSVSNFRPTAAASIYDKYCKGGVTWDMSGGWGGRLLGAMISGVDKYIATEPSTLTFKGLNKIVNDFNFKNVEIIQKGSEDTVLDKNSVDLCFTSPPYFNLEKYTIEATQSFIKYNTFDIWIDKFLGNTFLNCFNCLKNDGYMIINVANNPDSKYNIENETLKMAKYVGFKHETTLKLALSNVNMRNKENTFKYEPIFVFKK